MKTDQIAVQLYTLRDHLKSVPEFAETCRKVAAIGYRAVEVAGVEHAVYSIRLSFEHLAGRCGK